MPVPPISQSAILIFMSLRDSVRKPLEVHPSIPLDRAESLAMGRRGVTQAAIHYMNEAGQTRYVSSADCDDATQDADWHRLVQTPGASIPNAKTLGATYTVGSLNGRWLGFKMVRQVHSWDVFIVNVQQTANEAMWRAMVDNGHVAPQDEYGPLGTVRFPFCIDLQEFYGYEDHSSTVVEGEGLGYRHAFFDPNARHRLKDVRERRVYVPSIAIYCTLYRACTRLCMTRKMSCRMPPCHAGIRLGNSYHRVALCCMARYLQRIEVLDHLLMTRVCRRTRFLASLGTDGKHSDESGPSMV